MINYRVQTFSKKSVEYPSVYKGNFIIWFINTYYRNFFVSTEKT